MIALTSSTLMRRKGLLAFACSLLVVSARAQTTQILPTINTIAGSYVAGYTGNGGLATAATLSSTVSSAAYDSYGNLYIADSGNKVIRRVDAATGVISVYAGGGTVCAAATDTAGDGCPATQAVFQNPFEVRIIRGDLYIVDNTDNRVRKVSLATGMISIVLGTGASASVTYDLGYDTIVRTPEAVAMDSKGDIFVVQNVAPRVDRIDGTTGKVLSFAGTGVANKSGDGGISTSGALNSPIGIAVDSHDNVYIADKNNNCIRKITVATSGAATGTVSTYAGPQGTATTSGFAGDGLTADNALFGANGLEHIFFDNQDNLYVTDSVNGRIRKIAPPTNGQTAIGGIITTVAGNGTRTGTGNDGQYALNANLLTANDVTLSPAGDLVVTDKGLTNVRIVRPASVFPALAVTTPAAQTIWANAATGGTFTISGTPDFTVGATTCVPSPYPTLLAGQVCSAPVTFRPSLSGKRFASAIFTDSSNISIAQPVNGVGVAATASVIPGIINLASGSTTGLAGNTGDGTATVTYSKPGAVATDSVGNAYVVDSGNNEVRMVKLTLASPVVTRIAGNGTSGYAGDGGPGTAAALNNPTAVAVDGSGNVYIADTGNNVVRRVDAVTGIITTVAGSGTAAYSGDGSLATSATLNAPSGVAVSATGVLYIGDTGNNVIRTVGLRSGIILTIAGNGSSGFSGDGSPATAAQLAGPTGIALDIAGSLYITDTGNQRIREVDSSAYIKTLVGVGVAGYADGPIATAEISSPTAIAVDAAGDVYIGDTGSNRIRVLTGGTVTTVAGTGTTGLTGNGANSGLATLNAPRGVALDPANNLVFADSGNNQIRTINVASSTMVFPETSPATNSAAQQVELLSSGNQSLSLASVVLPAGFVPETSGSTDCTTAPLALAQTTACQLRVHFTPSTLGPYSGNIVFNDNAQSNAASTQTVVVTGVGKQVFKFTVTLPATAAAGSPVSATVTATNPNQAYTGTILFTSTDSQASGFPKSYTFTTADNGSHTFTGIVFGTAGIQGLTVTDSTDSQQSAVGTTTVTNGPAAKLMVLSGSPQSANIGAAFGSALVARVLDAFGNAVAGVMVTFTAPTSGPHAAFAGSATTTAVSDSLGRATTTVALTADYILGSYNVVASAPGAPGTALFALTNTSTVPADFTIVPASSIVGTVLPGASSAQQVTITPVGGFSATINLICATSDPTTSCTVGPTSVPGTDGLAQLVTLTFTTTGPNRTGSTMLRTTSSVLMCLGVFYVAGRKRRRALQWLSLAVLCAAGAASLTGCSATTLSQPRTPSGTITATITATSGSIAHTAPVQFVVGGD